MYCLEKNFYYMGYEGFCIFQNVIYPLDISFNLKFHDATFQYSDNLLQFSKQMSLDEEYFLMVYHHILFDANSYF